MMMKGNMMQITLNINPKLLAKLAADNEMDINELNSNIQEYFKSFENEELLSELINNTIVNY